MIQESKFSSNSKTPSIQNFITLRKDRRQGQGGGLLTLIHKSINFSRKPESPDTLSRTSFVGVDHHGHAGGHVVDPYQHLHTTSLHSPSHHLSWDSIKIHKNLCARNVTGCVVSYLCNRCFGWVHSKCTGLQNAAEYRRIKVWVHA